MSTRPDGEAERYHFGSRSVWARESSSPITGHFLAGDCSDRRYYRFHRSGDALPVTAVLMDAPPPHHSGLPAFIEKADMLRRMGLRAPRVYEADLDRGFLLMEDFGDRTYGRLIRQGHNPADLLYRAMDVLMALQDRYSFQRERPMRSLDTAVLLSQLSLFTSWYVPLRNILPTRAQEQEYQEIWRQILQPLELSSCPELCSLVLYDCHVDNLMDCPGEGVQACGLLDFQDAAYGSRAYDVVSLLEDARWDVSFPLSSDLKAYFLRNQRRALDEDLFHTHYVILSAQRALKNLGIFARLAVRDHKPHMLAHRHRVWRYLRRTLQSPVLTPLRHWVEAVFVKGQP